MRRGPADAVFGRVCRSPWASDPRRLDESMIAWAIQGCLAADGGRRMHDAGPFGVQRSSSIKAPWTRGVPRTVRPGRCSRDERLSGPNAVLSERGSSKRLKEVRRRCYAEGTLERNVRARTRVLCRLVTGRRRVRHDWRPRVAHVVEDRVEPLIPTVNSTACSKIGSNRSIATISSGIPSFLR
jgi:hypothetical protein